MVFCKGRARLHLSSLGLEIGGIRSRLRGRDGLRLRLRRRLERHARRPRREGCRARRDDLDRAPGSRRVHRHDRGLPCVPRGRRRMARRPVRRGVQAPGRPRAALRREEPRRSRRSAARLGAVGLAGVDAGDDGHDPEPRAESAVGRGTGAGVRQRAFRGRLVPPVRADVLQRGARRAERPVRGRAHAGEELAGRPRRRRPRRLRAARARRGVPLDQPRADRARLPGGPPGAARRRDHRGRLAATRTSPTTTGRPST